MVKFPSVLCVWLLFFFAFPTAPYVVLAFTGPVIGIIDGDTIDVLHNGQSERIRLNGIDCPEKGQGYGKKAKQFTSGPRSRKTDTAERWPMSCSRV
jgi:micrococcal nuclease